MEEDSSVPQGKPVPGRAQSGDDVDAYLRVVTAGVDLSHVQLRYTLPVTVAPWVAEFARIVSEELRNAGCIRGGR